jgi:methanogenic corrinoid protein MtbC1
MPIQDFDRAYTENLLAGNRRVCRAIIQQVLEQGSSPADLYENLLWPAMAHVEKLWKNDRINRATEQLATRINRMVADQLQGLLTNVPACGKKALLLCAPHEPEELGAQMICDMLETHGWEVYFLGGGVPDDEILMLVGLHRPDVLIVYGTRPEGTPAIRGLIDNIRHIDPCPEMNVMLAGGIFARTDGLWNEVRADLFASDLRETIEVVCTAEPRDPQARNSGVRRRRRRRPVMEVVGAVI